MRHDVDGHHAELRRRILVISFVLVMAFCLCGGFVFPALERKSELGRYERARSLFADLNALAEFKGCTGEVISHMDFCRNIHWFREHLVAFFGPDTSNSMVDRGHWTPTGSALFALSVASTIGYGAQSPHTHEGKVATVVFVALAVPAFACCAIIASSYLRAMARRWSEKVALSVRDLSPVAARGSSACEANAIGPLGELVILVLALWLAGAVVFSWIEDWSISRSLYFCFVTLSAVGFANVTPQSLAGRVLMLAYVSVGLASAASLASEVIDRMVSALGVRDEDEDEMSDDSAEQHLLPHHRAELAS